jgi:hypothetical protein
LKVDPPIFSLDWILSKEAWDVKMEALKREWAILIMKIFPLERNKISEIN